jgi:flagellar basal body rod protein FlgC
MRGWSRSSHSRIPSRRSVRAMRSILMIAVLEAQRAYEANASVFDVGKRLAERTLDVGRF